MFSGNIHGLSHTPVSECPVEGDYTMFRMLLWVLTDPGKNDCVLAENQGCSIFRSQAGCFFEKRGEEKQWLTETLAPDVTQRAAQMSNHTGINEVMLSLSFFPVGTFPFFMIFFQSDGEKQKYFLFL